MPKLRRTLIVPPGTPLDSEGPAKADCVFPRYLPDYSLSNAFDFQQRAFLLHEFRRSYGEYGSARLLEIGCGEGRLARMLAPWILEYVGLDRDSKRIDLARAQNPTLENASFIVGNAESFPDLPGRFDIALFAYSWHFVEAFYKALEGCVRVLNHRGIKNTGRVMVVEPSHGATRWRDERLRPGEKFDSDIYARKMSALERARNALYQQKVFDIIDSSENRGNIDSFWVLRPR